MDALAVVTHPAQAASLLQPLRRTLLERLREPDSAAGVAHSLGLPRQRVNYHVRQLEEEGLLQEVGERRKGNVVERLVQATARHYLVSPALAGDPSGADVGADRFSSTYLTAVSARAVAELAGLREAAATAGKKLPTLTLQAEVRFARPTDQQAFAEEMAEAFARIVARHNAEGAPGGRTFRIFLGGYPAPPPTPRSAAAGGEEEP